MLIIIINSINYQSIHLLDLSQNLFKMSITDLQETKKDYESYFRYSFELFQFCFLKDRLLTVLQTQ